MKKTLKYGLLALTLVAMFACSKRRSAVTGWEYNNPDWGGYQQNDYDGQETGPHLVLIEGGTYMQGAVEQDVTYDYNAIPRRITVPSFYMDETETANLHYREYLYWTQRTFGGDFPDVYKRALPDTLVWRDELAYNEPYVKYYLRHPSYQWYPVVGVSWLQATDYAKWRTDRVNEMILVREGIMDLNPGQLNEDNFNTESYMVGQYEGIVRKNLKDLNPTAESPERRVRMEDGILSPEYRLPTEAEWEYAALALIGNNQFAGEELVSDRRIYPWNGHSMRNPVHGTWQGDMLANYKRGRGDLMGVAGGLNDNASVTAPVGSFWPNEYGLYNMGGNVSEWVMDVYRPMTSADEVEYNSFRGNKFQTQELDEDGIIAEKDSLGKIKYRDVTEEETVNRRNYKKADVKNFLDGDANSLVTYAYSTNTLVSDKARVHKGGSWFDLAYYTSPGTRRFLDEDQSTAMIGFRCAMIRLGSPEGNGKRGGNNFKTSKSKF